MPGLEIKIKPKSPMGMNGGQEDEKAKIARIQEMANEMSALCDSMMRREEEEDQEEQGEQPEMGADLAEKAAFVRNYKK